MADGRGYNRKVLRPTMAGMFVLAGGLYAQTQFFPLEDIRPGLRGTGRTVFSGDRIEDFQVEILGILRNVGPKQSLILARLSGGPLERTGVMEGMSGSPVYLDGKLVGAVAMAFPYAKEAIAAIRPIQDMVRPSVLRPAAPMARAALAEGGFDLTGSIPRPEPVMAGEARLADIATPVSFGGFSRATLDAFGPQLRALGLDPRQGVGSGGNLGHTLGNPADLKPGSMISVALLAGDFNVDAQGTVTYIEGDRVYAFGHRFLSVGATALPFARADVIALVPNVNTSFKLSTAREWMGSIEQDRDTAIAGVLGKLPEMVPVSVTVSRSGRPIESYQMQMVNDPLLSPLLVQMAVFSAIDSTERTVGVASMRVTGRIDFGNALLPVRLNNVFAAENGTAQQVSLGAAVPLAYLMQSGFEGLRPKKVALEVEVSDEKKLMTIDSVMASRHEVRAGEKVELDILLVGQNGSDSVRHVEFPVPGGALPGPLYFTVSDAMVANLTDFRQLLTGNPRTAGQMVETVNNLHPNNRAYVRVWRTDPSFQLDGVELQGVPASAALVLESSQSNLAGVTQSRNAGIAELEIDCGDMVVSGVKTIQVEVKE